MGERHNKRLETDLQKRQQSQVHWQALKHAVLGPQNKRFQNKAHAG